MQYEKHDFIKEGILAHQITIKSNNPKNFLYSKGWGETCTSHVVKRERGMETANSVGLTELQVQPEYAHPMLIILDVRDSSMQKPAELSL